LTRTPPGKSRSAQEADAVDQPLPVKAIDGNGAQSAVWPATYTFLIDDIRTDADSLHDLGVKVGHRGEDLPVLLSHLLATLHHGAAVGIFDHNAIRVAVNERIEVVGVVRPHLAFDCVLDRQ
jgi:hypothetical protein